MSDLPKGWEWATLGEIGRWGSGGTPRRTESRYHGGDIPWALIGDLSDGVVTQVAATITEEGLAASSAKVVEVGTVLVAMYGSIGKLGIAGIPMATNQAIAYVKPDDRSISHRYLFHFLRSQRVLLNRAGKGATQQNIGQGVLKAWPLPLPPRTEQDRIVAAIEEHLSRLDAADASLLACSQRIHVLRGRCLTEVFATPAPALPLGDVALVGSGATPSRTQQRYWDNGDVPWVSSGALNQSSVGQPTAFITKAALHETSVKLWPAGTVLVAMYGEGKTRGRAAELGLESTCNQACAAIRPDPERLRSRYLRWWLNSRYDENRRLASGGVQPNLSLGLVKAMRVPLPSLDEQDQVIAELEDHTTRLDRVHDETVAASRRSSALRRSILAAAFSGKLVPQDPDDEPASVLLERIRAERTPGAEPEAAGAGSARMT
ncbi:restriction endonuclease subunit S [Iamia sp.]|uniref:restriction endonuclease subunit S n=1 Tax=Iamia sp. TaxID=2722710 RepID=UPI002BACA555|nr:restriction endonuclease subunit S [Iamia sp.]HXH56506.1 restriction endonuclease subunit S [Iamia sp.]